MPRLPLFPRFALAFFALLLLCGGASRSAHAQQYRIIDLTTLGGFTTGSANGINQIGQVVGNGITSNNVTEGFVYAYGIVRPLGNPNGYDSNANAISNNGKVTGSYGSGPQVFRTSAGKAIVSATDNLGSLGSGGRGYAINISGQVAGTSNLPNTGPFHAFLWTAGGTNGVAANPQMQDLGTLGGGYSQASGINDNGQVVGNATVGINFIPHAFLWTAGGTDGTASNPQMSDLGVLPGYTDSAATAINTNGQITVIEGQGGGNYSHSFLYTPSAGSFTTTDLGLLPGYTMAIASALNNSGQAVGAASNSIYSSGPPVLFSGGTVVDLNTLLPSGSGWTLRSATGINDLGQIVGSGTVNGQSHAFLLTPAALIGPVSLSFSANPVEAGQSTTGTVRLSAPAPLGGMTLALTINGTDNGTVTVPEGQSSQTFDFVIPRTYDGQSVSVAATGNSTSAACSVVINSAVPTLTSISPATATAGSTDLTLTLTGTGFIQGGNSDGGYVYGSVVLWNGQRLFPTAASPTQLTVTVPAFYLTTPGTAQIAVFNLGPYKMSNVLTFTITAPPDTTAPTTTASLSGTAGANGWYTSAVQVTLAATDNAGGSGVASTFYTIDGGSQQTYTSPFIVSGDAAHIVTFYSTDNAGNAESVKTQAVPIDTTPPTLTFGTPTPAANAAGWNNTTVDVPFTATDAMSGVAGSAPGSPVHFAAEGAGQMQTVTVADNAGNRASFTTPAVNIDLTAPVTTATVNGATVTLSATDALSGVASTVYSIDGGAQQTYAAPFTVTGAGTHTVSYFSTDVAGNAEAAQTLNVTVPITIVSLSLSPASVKGGAATSTGTITLSGPAPAGGVSVTQTSSDTSAATLAPKLNIPAGASSAKFKITTYAVSANKSVTMTSALNGSSQAATLTVTGTPPAVTVVSLTLSPTSVKGGNSSTGTITLSGPAPAGGVSITQTSSDTTAATLAPKLSVPAGATSARFKITTYAVPGAKSVTITSALNGTARMQTLTVTH